MSKLDDILDELQSQSATDDLSNDWEGQLAEAKQQTKDLMLEIIGEDINEPRTATYQKMLRKEVEEL